MCPSTTPVVKRPGHSANPSLAEVGTKPRTLHPHSHTHPAVWLSGECAAIGVVNSRGIADIDEGQFMLTGDSFSCLVFFFSASPVEGDVESVFADGVSVTGSSASSLSLSRRC